MGHHPLRLEHQTLHLGKEINKSRRKILAIRRTVAKNMYFNRKTKIQPVIDCLEKCGNSYFTETEIHSL